MQIEVEIERPDPPAQIERPPDAITAFEKRPDHDGKQPKVEIHIICSDGKSGRPPYSLEGETSRHQINKSLFGSFSSEKELLAFLAFLALPATPRSS
jgi:hypothetical protein